MCKAVSWWMTQKGSERTLYISDNTDSHREIAAEFGIEDAPGVEVCAGEFWPDPTKPSPDVTTWTLEWDAPTTRPKWLDDAGLAWLRSELETRCKAFVFNGDGSIQEVAKSCRAFVFGKARAKVTRGTATAWGSSSVEARESSRVVARGSSSVVAWESSSVVAWESSSVVARESSRVEAWGSSSVEARESSRVEAWESSRVEAWESSSVVARESSRVVARGSSSVVAWESSSVEASSAYVTLAFRKAWDGKGYLPVWCNHNGNGTYKATATGYERVDVPAAK